MIIIGFILLIWGADLLIKGSSNIAKKFNISEIIIGLTIVALGTSTPELIITISSALKNSTDLIIGNAIGSNLCNLLLIMGVIAILRPIKIDKETRLVHLPVALLSTIVVLGLGIGVLGSPNNIINRTDGIILVSLYLMYFLYPVIIEIKNIRKTMREKKKKQFRTINTIFSILFIVIGIFSLKVGGDIVVSQASKIALEYNISERVIGLTIVAIGTALPELVTSIISIIKKEEDLAVGNLLGSCILNSFLILGAGSIITPLEFSLEFIFNLVLLIFSIILIWLSCLIGKKNIITRYNAVLLLIIYFVYKIKLF